MGGNRHVRHALADESRIANLENIPRAGSTAGDVRGRWSGDRTFMPDGTTRHQ